MEQTGLTNDQIRQQISPVFQQMVKELHTGTPSQRQHAESIKGLFDANQQFKAAEHAKKYLVVPGARLPPVAPASKPDPAPRRHRGGRI